MIKNYFGNVEAKTVMTCSYPSTSSGIGVYEHYFRLLTGD